MIPSDDFNAYKSILGRSHRRVWTCTDDACRNQQALVFKLVAVIFGISAVIFIYHWCKRQSIPTHESYVNSPASEIETQDLDCFESGLWTSRYYQYNGWHGPYRLSLLFNPETRSVSGSGSDDVGTYTIVGIYSTRTNRMGLTKSYQTGTGDLQENLGHNVTIQMAWNSIQSQFEGRWFVRTNAYSGEDNFELKLEKSFRSIQ